MQELIELKSLIYLDKWLITYLIFIFIDFVTGIIKAYKTDGFKSRKLREGIIKVFSELLAIVFAGILDYLLGLNMIMLAMKMMLVFKEAISIVENLGMIGIQLPDIIKDKIQDLNPDKNKEG